MNLDASKLVPLTPPLISLFELASISLLDARRFLLILFSSIHWMCLADAQLTTQPYQYTGGTLTVKIVFNFDTNVVTDSVAGSSHLEPILTITNTRTGRSIVTSYISENDYMTTSSGNVLIGSEVAPGEQNPRTNIGTVIVDASSLGPGPLVFSTTGHSELAGPAAASFRNVFGGPFYVWTISPQSITPSLSPYVPRPSPTPISNATAPVPVSTNIHAVIISGRSDPAKIVTSQNVTLTGGVVALGKDPAPPAVPSAWTTGLHILPDEALLTGAKIPPVTPNIVDVRIVKHEVVGDLAAPSASP
jgi:hypothetical protein